MRKHFISLLLIYVFVSFPIYSQDFLPKEEPIRNQKEAQLIQLERAFLEWADGKDLSETKGWKWYRRWLEEQIQRSSFRGELPDYRPLFEAAKQVSAQKERTIESRGSANWIPIGPSVYPDVSGTPIFEGLGRINTVSFHPTDPNTFWVGVAQGGVWKTTNSGESWTPLTDDLPILRISDIAVDPKDPNIMYISVGDYAYLGIALELDERKRHTHYGLGVYKTIDGGENWKPTGLTFDQTEKDISLTRRVFIHPENTKELVAVGINGSWRSSDAGDTWKKILGEVMMDLEKHPSNPNVLYAASGIVRNLEIGYPAVWKSEDFGNSWKDLTEGLFPKDSVRRIEIAVAPSNPNYIYAITARPNGGLYGFYQSKNGGESWELMSKSPNVLHWYFGTSQGGQGNYDLGIMVHPEDPNTVYAGGINLWGTEDGGRTWEWGSYWLPSFGKSIHADHHFYKYNPLDEYFYVCHDGGIARTKKIITAPIEDVIGTDNYTWETEWEHIASGMQTTSFYRMGFSPINQERFIAGAQDNSVMLKREDGWKNIMLGDGMESFFHSENEDIMFFATQFGRLARSEDGGNSIIDTVANAMRREESGAWTTPYMNGPQGGNTVYSAFGNVWKSNNLGDNWVKLTDIPAPEGFFLPPISALSIAPSDTNVIYFGTRIYPTAGIKGTFWRTTNEGRNTINITRGLPDTLFFTSSTVSDMSPKKIWVSVGGFADGLKVFYSEDGGDNWQNVSYNLPNVPVNTIRHQAGSMKDIVYIGTDVGVYYLDTETNTWVLYSDGLPNVIISDLDISVERNKIYAATFGRGLWAGDLVNNDPTSLSPIKNASVSLYPNPNTGNFRLSISHPKLQDAQVQIVDILGRTLHAERLFLSNGEINENFQLGLLPGFYFLRISKDKFGKVIKFQVK